ncbi:hypothetical protein [Rhizobium sp. CSW-27]|uniref:hypothetical protein n=1 Tax=Rhizobium sp. CSW-27 TaxID=2839985 RepID=UPI001C03621A|nr:hypothetical protein [Rhizobium sp. CSW-27]MBT9373179.1 hypothetical protein [Rhizobium sp. CSW-27]
MTVSTYRLTTLGKLGALMFVAPTPIGTYYLMPPAMSEGDALFERRLRAMGGAADVFTPSPAVLALLATATLIGFILLLIGREIVTEG